MNVKKNIEEYLTEAIRTAFIQRLRFPSWVEMNSVQTQYSFDGIPDRVSPSAS